jgi:cell division protein FtsI/penicillin-binding protein 2
MKNERLVIDMYLMGSTIKDITVASGYNSPQSIMNILDRNRIERNNIKSQSLPISKIVSEWISDVTANSRSIANQFGCSANMISAILKNNISVSLKIPICCKSISICKS